MKRCVYCGQKIVTSLTFATCTAHRDLPALDKTSTIALSSRAMDPDTLNSGGMVRSEKLRQPVSGAMKHPAVAPYLDPWPPRGYRLRSASLSPARERER